MFASISYARADQARVLIQAAFLLLEKDPNDPLYGCTGSYFNSEGVSYWKESIIELYRKAEHFDEGFIQLELLAIMERALQNQLTHLSNESKGPLVDLTQYGFPMRLQAASSLTAYIATKSPLTAIGFKVYANKLTMRVSGLSYATFISRHCFCGRVPKEVFERDSF